MKRRTAGTLMALVLGATLGASTALAADQRPIAGRFTAQAGPTAARCGADLTLGFEIRGVVSHLGAMTGTGSNCTEWTLATDAVAIWDGRAAFRAADGSTLTTVSDGAQGVPVGGVATFEVTHTVTGGTGRFTGARGVWLVTGVIDLGTAVIGGRASGWLSY